MNANSIQGVYDPIFL